MMGKIPKPGLQASADLYLGNPTASYVAEHSPLDEEEMKEFEACCVKHGLDPKQFKSVRRSVDFSGWVASVPTGETWVFDNWDK